MPCGVVRGKQKEEGKGGGKGQNKLNEGNEGIGRFIDVGWVGGHSGNYKNKESIWCLFLGKSLFHRSGMGKGVITPILKI